MALKGKRTNLKKTVRDLEMQLKDWDTSIAELRARVLDVQLLKFGRKIDLEKLDSMTVNKVTVVILHCAVVECCVLCMSAAIVADGRLLW